jgi:Fe2+ or Zn2+ uptake regulation protein
VVAEDLTQLLRDRGMRVTPQRLVIYRVLRERGGHLTADDVHDELATTLPGISRQTVHSTLALLAELGVIRRVATPGGTSRYESRTEEHHHTVCESCGALEDLELRLPVARAMEHSRATGFSPSSATMTVMGRCAACAANQ